MPDDKTNMAYLMQLYNYFTKMKSEDIIGQRLRGFLQFEEMIAADQVLTLCGSSSLAKDFIV